VTGAKWPTRGPGAAGRAAGQCRPCGHGERVGRGHVEDHGSLCEVGARSGAVDAEDIVGVEQVLPSARVDSLGGRTDGGLAADVEGRSQRPDGHDPGGGVAAGAAVHIQEAVAPERSQRMELGNAGEGLGGQHAERSGCPGRHGEEIGKADVATGLVGNEDVSAVDRDSREEGHPPALEDVRSSQRDGAVGKVEAGDLRVTSR